MTLDDEIRQAEEAAKSLKYWVESGCCCDDTEIEDEYIKRAEEYQQLAEWLKDYKRLLKKENAKTPSPDSSPDPEIYWCDPKKNKDCRKTACQKECFMTTKKEYAKTEPKEREETK